MSSLTPQEYADMLGLKPGLDVEPSAVLDNKQMAPLHAWAKASNDQPTADKLPEVFWREFGSFYLPSLIRTFFLNDFVAGTDKKWGWIVLCGLICRGENGDSLSRDLQRYAASDPKQIISFLFILARRLVDVGSPNAPPGADYFISWFLAAAETLLSTLMVVLIVPDYCDLVTASGRPFASALLKSIQNIRNKFKRKTERTMDGFNSIINFLETSAKEPYPPRSGSPDGPDAPKCPPAFSCELFPIGPPAPGRCVQPPKDWHMQECGGCLAVHYCSRAHQKEDWKKHKLVCFPPGW